MNSRPDYLKLFALVCLAVLVTIMHFERRASRRLFFESLESRDTRKYVDKTEPPPDYEVVQSGDEFAARHAHFKDIILGVYKTRQAAIARAWAQHDFKKWDDEQVAKFGNVKVEKP